MSRQVVLRSFTRPHGRSERVRNLWLSLGSLLLHVIVLLLLPGLAIKVQAPREITFELLSNVVPLEFPIGDEFADDAGVPESSGIEPTVNTEPTEGGAGQPAASEQSSTEPTTAAPATPAPATEPVAEPVATQPEPVQLPPIKDNQLESTEVDISPPPVKESPVVVPPPPAKPEPVPAVKPPTPKEDATPPEPTPETPPVKPEPTPKSAPQEPSGGADTAPPGPESDSTGESEEPGTDAGESGEEEGPPPPPPGPTPGELVLLKGYGDSALKRIQGQARQPEAGGRGTVKFAFIIDRNGHLVDVFIVATSGRKLLDDDVLDATRAAFNDAWEIVAFPKGISLLEYQFERSITYPLY